MPVLALHGHYRVHSIIVYHKLIQMSCDPENAKATGQKTASREKTMKCRILCSKCKLTIYARTEERLDEIASKLKCYCDIPPEKRLDKPIKEIIGKRILSSVDTLWLIKHLYE